MHETRAAQGPHLYVGQAEPGARSCNEVGDRARVTEGVRRLQVDEVRDCLERGVEGLAGQHHRERRLGVDYGAPRGDRVQAGEDQLRVGPEERRELRVELLAAALARERLRSLDSADAVSD